MFAIFAAYYSRTYTGNFTFSMSCPYKHRLLSCGMSNSQMNTTDWFRSSVPMDAYSCLCRYRASSTCMGWCTNHPINNMELASSRGKGIFNVSCSAGKKVLGCHIDPITNQVENWRFWYPSPDGTACICYDFFGADCIATCASNINSYEVVSVWGSDYVIASCSKANNQVLGCGSDPTGASAVENFRATWAQTSSCICFDRYRTICYAICGQLW